MDWFLHDSGFLMFSGSIEREQWYEIGYKWYLFIGKSQKVSFCVKCSG